MNATKLDIELKSAGIQISSVDSTGIVLDTNGDEIQSRADVKAVIAAHDPRDYIKERREAAKGEAAKVTALKTITPAQAAKYIDDNVDSLASAKTVLKLMATMMIAMRDEVWPTLPEE